MKMDLVPPLAVPAYSIQPLEDYDGPRAPLVRQVSLDEERRDDCQGHWTGSYLTGEEEERGVRLFRAMLLQHLRLEGQRAPPCIMAPAIPDSRDCQTGTGVNLITSNIDLWLHYDNEKNGKSININGRPSYVLRGWWMYWRDWRALERAAKRFRETKARALLANRAAQINLLGLDEVAFEDIMQELCQSCVHTEHRSLLVLAFLCEVVSRAVRCGGWCRCTDWAARHVAQCATPAAIRQGGWSVVVERAGGCTRRDENAFLAGAAFAAIIVFLFFRRIRMRQTFI